MTTVKPLEFDAKVIDSGRITIPKKKRRAHGIKDGVHVHAVVTKLVEASS